MEIKKEYGIYSYENTQGTVTKDVIDAFGHLIKEGENVKLREMYDRIKSHYSSENPKVKDILKRLETETELTLVIKDKKSNKELYKFKSHHDSLSQAEDYIDNLARMEVKKSKYAGKTLDVEVLTREGGVLKKGTHEAPRKNKMSI